MTTIILSALDSATRREIRRAVDKLHDRDDSCVSHSKIETLRGRGVALHFDHLAPEVVRVQSHAIHRAVMLSAGTTAIECDCN